MNGSKWLCDCGWRSGVVAVLFSFILGGCGEVGGGGYSEDLQYDDAAWSLSTLANRIYSEHIAGTRTGYFDTTVPGPGGGTIHITGDVSWSATHDITSVNLNYNFNNCVAVVTSSDGDVTVTLNSLNGIINQTGSWRSTTILQAGYNNTTFRSDNVSVSATVSRSGESATLSVAGSYFCTITANTAYPGAETVSSTGGNLAGHQFSW